MPVKILFLDDHDPSIIFDTEEFNKSLKMDKCFKEYNNWKYIPIDAKLDGR